MISFVRGKLVDIFEDKIVVDLSNIALEISLSLSDIEKLPKLNSDIMVYTHFKVSEDAMSLYGFLDRKKLNIFKLLISVNGLGPKGALAILSILEMDELVMAIMGEDEKIIAKANGIGIKTAKRIIIELKDKIKLENIINYSQNTNTANENKVIKETIEALTALGYSLPEASKAVKSLELSEDITSSKAIKMALRKL